MPEEKVEKVEAEAETKVPEVSAIANLTNLTTIPNSTAEFCIYTYKAEFETYGQLTAPGFFNSLVHVVEKGDTIRVFKYDLEKKLTHYLEFIVVETDKITKTVTVATVTISNLMNKLVK